jgi:hypothetical protein
MWFKDAKELSMGFPSSSMKLPFLVGLCEQQSLDLRVQGLLLEAIN